MHAYLAAPCSIQGSAAHPLMRNWEAATSERLKSLDSRLSWRPCGRLGRAREGMGGGRYTACATCGPQVSEHAWGCRPVRLDERCLACTPAATQTSQPAAGSPALPWHPPQCTAPRPCTARTARCAARRPATQSSSPHSGWSAAWGRHKRLRGSRERARRADCASSLYSEEHAGRHQLDTYHVHTAANVTEQAGCLTAGRLTRALNLPTGGCADRAIICRASEGGAAERDEGDQQLVRVLHTQHSKVWPLPSLVLHLPPQNPVPADALQHS